MLLSGAFDLCSERTPATFEVRRNIRKRIMRERTHLFQAGVIGLGVDTTQDLLDILGGGAEYTQIRKEDLGGQRKI